MSEPVPIQRKGLVMARPVASVFGGSAPKPGEAMYTEAGRLGGLLVESGYDVMTGGYSGLMEAVSRGVQEAGGHVTGVTVARFDREGHRPNAYNDEVVRCDTLPERLLHLVTRCDAAVALPGGIGTLSEVALTWSLLQVGRIDPMPFILLGDAWRSLIQTFYGDGFYIRERDLHLIQFARTPEQVVPLLKDWR
jgi:uncharacterized protein (TIGR00730 family)